jgi:hypothetical protein
MFTVGEGKASQSRSSREGLAQADLVQPDEDAEDLPGAARSGSGGWAYAGLAVAVTVTIVLSILILKRTHQVEIGDDSLIHTQIVQRAL